MSSFSTPTSPTPTSTPAIRSTSNFAPDWMEVLYEVTRQFASSLELDEVLGKVLTLTVNAVNATAGSIFLLDTNGRVVRSIIARESLPPQIKYPMVNTVMSKGFAGWVYSNQQASIIADTNDDPRWHFFPDDTMVTRSAVAAPLIKRDIVIGVVIMMHPEPAAFNRRELQLLEAIAGQAATAIDNAALYTKSANERSVLTAIIASARDIIIVADTRDRVILINPMAQRSLGIPDQFYGKAFNEVFTERALIEYYTVGGQEEQSQREVRFEDGRVFECALARVPNVGKVLNMHDVTTFKQLDALKSEFVSHVAHDLKAPLGVMQGYTWLLNDHPDLSDESRTYVHQITESIHRMRGLIDNILDIGRIEMGIQAEFQPVLIANVVHESIKNMQSFAKDKQIVLEPMIDNPDLKVSASALRLGQAVTNLVGNALKFTPPGGSVTVMTGLENGQVTVRIVDTGPGIPPHLQAKLFQKFSRLGQGATQKNEGHGLGLAIVKSVVEAHGGRVWVESQAGKGSTFAFALPHLSEETIRQVEAGA